MIFIERLGEIVRRQPGRPAIVERGVCALTYGALWAKAAGIAHRLRARGVGPEQLVALHLSKSPESVAALLGTWMARAAFVPLDPVLPLARRRELVAQARPAIVLGQPLAGTAWLPVEGPPADGPVGRGAAGQLAYVFFTSGSSGRPKGVAVEQRGLVPMLEAQRRAFGLSARSRALGHLPDEQREAVALVMIEGLAYREAAEVLDVPIGTLTSRLVRGRQALLGLLGEE